MNEKRKYAKRGLALRAVLDTPEGQLVYLAQLNRELMAGKIKPDLARTSVSIVDAARRVLEFRDGQKIKVDHSGTIGLRAADKCFDRVFGNGQTPDAELPTGVDPGPEPDAGVAQGPSDRRIDGDSV